MERFDKSFVSTGHHARMGRVYSWRFTKEEGGRKKGVKWKKKIEKERGEKWRKGIKKETSESSDKNNRSKPACSSKGLTPSTRRLFHVQFTSSSKSLCVTRSGENRFSTWINGNKYFRFLERDGDFFRVKIFFDSWKLCNILRIISKYEKTRYYSIHRESILEYDSNKWRRNEK